ncbi:hypothetical protein MNB_SV-13-1339 [hydrothermal vent metagenome]|uniref:Uncharacterized protein n=1 Tax=hydrothermal vent metagenome TaxID=652676 RepID=A0A1W1CYN2_9ZZZZ
MQLIVFLVEVILIFFYLQWEELGQLIEPSNEQYSSYYSTDIIGNDILKFSISMKEKDKLAVLKKSELINEVIKYIPKIDVMSEIFRNGIEDESDFKDNFIEYMESLHFKYLGEEITIEEFQELIKNPKNIHCLD